MAMVRGQAILTNGALTPHNWQSKGEDDVIWSNNHTSTHTYAMRSYS
jgi:hypothetical protein